MAKSPWRAPDGVPEPMTSAPAVANAQTIAQKLEAQHPLHGMAGRVFEAVGGEDFLTDWAEENPTEFIKLMFKLAPVAQPKGQTGSVHLHLHQDLQPGALDGGLGHTFENGE